MTQKCEHKNTIEVVDGQVFYSGGELHDSQVGRLLCLDCHEYVDGERGDPERAAAEVDF